MRRTLYHFCRKGYNVISLFLSRGHSRLTYKTCLIPAERTTLYSFGESDINFISLLHLAGDSHDLHTKRAISLLRGRCESDINLYHFCV